MWKAVLHPETYRQLSLRPNFYVVLSLLVIGYFAWVGLKALLNEIGAVHPSIQTARWVLEPVVYAAAILAVIAWSSSESLFIYFQF